MLENKNLGQEPAFPYLDNKCVIGNTPSGDFGMSKRFYAACAAMQGILSSNKEGLYCDKQDAVPSIGLKERYTLNTKHLVKLSYQIADEILKQEESE